MGDWTAEFVGKGYREGASGPEEYDCWALCVEIKKRQGMQVPMNIFGWRRVLRRLRAGERPREYDLVLFEDIETGVVFHAGTMVNESDFLHSCKEAGGVVVDRVSRYPAYIRLVARYVG